MRPAAALLLLLYMPARAADLCGTVTVLGRPLPEGFVTLAGDDRAWNGVPAHPGATERSFVRFKDGAFCLRDVAAGDYNIWISPLGLWEPMATVFSGLDKGPEGYRMSVSSDGAVTLFDAGGKSVRRDRRVALAYAEPRAEADWARLQVKLDFENKPSSYKSPHAGLILLHMQFLGYFFSWVDLSEREPAFDLAVKPWKLVDTLAWAPGWAIGDTEPVFHQLYSDSISFKAAEQRPFTLRLGRSGVVEGHVTGPDGAPFRPYLGPDRAKRAVFGFFVSNLGGTVEFHAYTDEDGYFRFEAPEGLWQVQPLFERGDGYSVRTGPQTLAWLEPGRTVTMNYHVPERGLFRVDHSSVPLETFWEQEFTLYPRRDHWVLAFPAGRLDPLESFQFLNREEAVFALAQRPNGRWRISEGAGNSSDDEWLPVPVGHYDLYIVESDRLSPPSSRVLAVKTGVLISSVLPYELALSSAELYAQGRAELAGRISASMKLTWDDVLKVDSVRRFQMTLAPHVNLYDQQGRFAGAAFADISHAQFAAALQAITRHDLEKVSVLLYSGPRPYKITGLPAGRYRAEVIAHGYPPRERSVELKDGEPLNWDVDFDAPEAAP